MESHQIRFKNSLKISVSDQEGENGNQMLPTPNHQAKLQSKPLESQSALCWS